MASLHGLLKPKLKYLAYVGMETDLIFNKGVELPGGFASFPLTETQEGRDLLGSYADWQVALAVETGCGLLLETATWLANRDRAMSMGYDAEYIRKANAASVALCDAARRGKDAPHILISANIGPRDDAYAPAEQMGVNEAAAYHEEQIKAVAEAGADVVSGYTVAYAAEAVGMALAAGAVGIPSVVSFTVETDGRLPDGMPLSDAVAMVDDSTDATPEYYMVNCAHPDHFSQALGQGTLPARLRGLVVNASRCSHAELDEAEELDDGNPQELGQQLGALSREHPTLQVFGGCCGTDRRHMAEIAAAI